MLSFVVLNNFDLVDLLTTKCARGSRFKPFRGHKSVTLNIVWARDNPTSKYGTKLKFLKIYQLLLS